MRLKLRHIAFLLLLLLVVSVAVDKSCRVHTTALPRPSAIAGCMLARDALGTLRCQLPASAGPHELVLWIEGERIAEREATLRNGWSVRTLPVQSAIMERGTRLTVSVDGGGDLEVAGRWVPLAVRPPTPELDALERRWNAWNEASAPHALLDELASFARTAPAWPAALAWELRGKILQHTSSTDETTDSIARALEAYERAIELAGPGELSVRCRMGLRIAELHLIDRGNPDDAERAIERMAECEALGIAHDVRVENVRGLAAFDAGELTAAVAHLEHAAAAAEQLGLRRLGMVAAQRLVAAEVGMGRFEAASEAHRWASAQAAELELGCDDELGMAAYGLYVAVHDPRGQEARLAKALREVLALRRSCPSSARVSSATILDIAFALAHEERHEEALHWLRELDDHSLVPVQSMYRASIEADVAMNQGDWAAAAAAADRLAAMIDEHPHEANVALEVQRELVRGRVAEASKDHEGARRHLRSAIARQDHQLHGISLGLAASRVSAREAAPAGYLVQLERDQGQLEAALCTARLVRNRAGRRRVDAAREHAHDRERYEPLRRALQRAERAFEDADEQGFGRRATAKAQLMDAQQDLLVALTEASRRIDHDPEDTCRSLPEPAPGELALLFHRGPDGHWLLFEWMLDEPVVIHDLGPGDPSPNDDPARLAKRLLGPVHERLGRASRLRLLSSGAFDAIPIESLPTSDGTLESNVVITWALDLPTRPELWPEPMAVRRPTVVFTSPRLNLNRLRPRVDTLTETATRAWKIDVKRLAYRSTSTRDLRQFSAGAAPLIVIGHSSGLEELDVDNPECGEPPSLESTNNPGRVHEPEKPTPGLWINSTSADLVTILTLDPPRVAILESCATGAIDTLSMDGPAGLGPVLVAAGTQQVLATRRKVCPEQALAFVQALVEASADQPLDLPLLLRASRDADPDYLHRVIVP